MDNKIKKCVGDLGTLQGEIKTLEKECRKYGVDILTGTTCTDEVLTRASYDTLVIATGAKPRGLCFQYDQKLFSPADIISGTATTPKKILIVGGNGVGLGVAVFLLRRGEYELTIVEESGKLGRDVNPFYLWQYIKILKEKKAKIRIRSSLVGAEGANLVLSGVGSDQNIEADAVVVALQDAQKNWPSRELTVGKDVLFIGDAKKPRRLNNAIHDGYRLGMVI